MKTGKKPPSGGRKEKKIFKGLVIPSGWDREGQVIRVVIAAFDETEWEIESAEIMEELVPYVHQEVEISGWAKSRGGDRRLIEVEGFRVNR
ncbi:MAG: hypothetical protein V1816_24345 [Pseudomonadota bacterium]